ncbi:hypothetical protein N7495_000729 [Penicillium taxi]|uniref:uncharacterized protein n=1 Tax=Penicillium taxi TaxID=168475 RepID=UPI0025458A42|nr:uncharacterized protein N7495_000729 [Penicillium taxi]KAJ5908047.1 hypothetical protein N7495_000729 [Penicillium taxi]
MIVQCSDERFKHIEAICASEVSPLSQNLSPLLKAPISVTSVSRFKNEIKLVRPGDEASKCLEFTTLYDSKRPLLFKAFLDQFMPGESCRGLLTVPVRSFTSTAVFTESIEGREALCFCIEWKSLQDRAAVFEDSSLRESMKFDQSETRAVFCQTLGKVEEKLTWEEDLQAYMASSGAKKIQSRFVTATLVTDEYLGMRKGNGLCMIM